MTMSSISGRATYLLVSKFGASDSSLEIVLEIGLLGWKKRWYIVSAFEWFLGSRVLDLVHGVSALGVFYVGFRNSVDIEVYCGCNKIPSPQEFRWSLNFSSRFPPLILQHVDVVSFGIGFGGAVRGFCGGVLAGEVGYGVFGFFFWLVI